MRILISSVMAGICVSIGGIVFLSMENRTAGAVAFSVGLFFICSFGFHLFTGKVCYIWKEHPLQLAVIWAGNLAGSYLTAAAIGLTRFSQLSDKAAGMCRTKFGESPVEVIVLGIFCNILIYAAVEGYRTIPDAAGKYLALIYGVAVFILCGFEHCVANMFYISAAGMWGTGAVKFLLLNTAGNAVGGIGFAEIRKYLQKE